MRYICATDGDVFGTPYTAGAEVDTADWTRRRLTDALRAGVIAPADVHPAALADVLGTQGPAARLGVTTGQVVVVVEPTVATLDDVDLTGLEDGMTLVYDGAQQVWKVTALRSARSVGALSDVVATPPPADGQTIVWSAPDQCFLYGDPRPGVGSAVSGWMDYTPQLLGSVTNPTMGTSMVAGEWMRTGMSAIVRGAIMLKTGFTVGSGDYAIGLPVPMVYGDDHDFQVDAAIGTAWLSGNGSATILAGLLANPVDPTHTSAWFYGTNSPTVSTIYRLGSGGPAGTVWAVGGSIRFEARYHIASGY